MGMQHQAARAVAVAHDPDRAPLPRESVRERAGWFRPRASREGEQRVCVCIGICKGESRRDRFPSSGAGGSARSAITATSERPRRSREGRAAWGKGLWRVRSRGLGYN